MTKIFTLTQITLPTHIHNCIVNFGLTDNYGELSFNDLILKQTCYSLTLHHVQVSILTMYSSQN